MASIAPPLRRMSGEDRFFFGTAVAMALTVVAGFSLQWLMGRSTFGAPLIVHLHAVVFMGWVGLYVTQAWLAANRSLALHRALGWIGAAWMFALLVLGTVLTVMMVRRGAAPFFFQPLHFLVFNPASVIAFVGLTAAAIVKRRQTAWHRRLHYCGMAMLLGPAFGRLLPMPLLIPHAYYAVFVATLVFPAIGVVSDLRRTGRVHPAWLWGIGAMVVTAIVVDAVTFSPAGETLYAAVTAGTPGAAVPPLDFAPMPAAPLITGR